MPIDLLKALRLPKSPIVTFVGAGGKTTALFQLTQELEGSVIVTATTHLGAWQIPLADKHIIAKTSASLDGIEHNLSGVILVTGEIRDDRTQPIKTETLKWQRAYCEEQSIPLLIEADGSRQKPLKAPGEHEPAIPEFAELVVQVVGINGLGKPLSEQYVHRPKIFSRLSGLQLGETITPESLVSVLTNPEGGLKNIPEKAHRVVLFNQADTPELQSQAVSIAKNLSPAFDSAIIATLNEGTIHAVREPIAGIILAAGESRRFGGPKQLLDWRGEPFVRVIAKIALEAGLSPVNVVVGAHAEQVKAAIKDFPVQIVYNPEWESGQASSIKRGVSTLTPAPSTLAGTRPSEGEGNPGAAIFLLADQPQATTIILHALMEAHASSLASIIAPLILDQRGNPVLFDRSTFPDLMKLEGDIGGRGIFSKHKLTYLPWHDNALLLDVDTPEHYQRLKEILE